MKQPELSYSITLENYLDLSTKIEQSTKCHSCTIHIGQNLEAGQMANNK